MGHARGGIGRGSSRQKESLSGAVTAMGNGSGLRGCEVGMDLVFGEILPDNELGIKERWMGA